MSKLSSLCTTNISQFNPLGAKTQQNYINETNTNCLKRCCSVYYSMITCGFHLFLRLLCFCLKTAPVRISAQPKFNTGRKKSAETLNSVAEEQYAKDAVNNDPCQQTIHLTSFALTY